MKPAKKFRIILLDDNDALRIALSELLVDSGYEVFPFSDPGICPLQSLPECQCTTNQTCADIILSDVDMPNMTGLGFIETQQKKNCKCRHVALMSGGWTDEDLARAHELGCKTFAKPFNFQELCAWLDEIKKSIDPQRELCNWVLDSEFLAKK